MFPMSYIVIMYIHLLRTVFAICIKQELFPAIRKRNTIQPLTILSLAPMSQAVNVIFLYCNCSTLNPENEEH